MNRRTFLKRVGQAITGIVALLFMAKAKRPKCHGLDIGPELECTPEMKGLCEQEDKVRCDGHGNPVIRTDEVMDFSPDKVIGMVNEGEDTLLFFCEHSIWKMKQDSSGNWRREQLRFNGVLPNGILRIV